METSARSYDLKMFAIGAVAVAGGLYFIAVGFGLMQPPSRINGPLWLSICAGIVFLLGGVSMVLRGYLKMDDSETDLPADAPRWAKLVWWGNALAICVTLASLGTWVAFGPGTRSFSVAGLISGSPGETIGRAAFGLGAIISWLIVFAFARAAWRRASAKPNAASAP